MIVHTVRKWDLLEECAYCGEQLAIGTKGFQSCKYGRTYCSEDHAEKAAKHDIHPMLTPSGLVVRYEDGSPLMCDGANGCSICYEKEDKLDPQEAWTRERRIRKQIHTHYPRAPIPQNQSKK